MEPCVRKERPKDLQPNVFLRKLTAVYYVVLDEDLTRAYTRGCPGGSAGKEFTCIAGDARDESLIPGLGRSPGRGHSTPLHYCCWENPMNRGAWQVVVHGVAKSWT